MTVMKASHTKERILESALRLFSKKGYMGATTKDIAKEAGIAEVTLFRHFASKEKLLGEVIRTYSFLPTLKGLVREIEGLPYEDALREIAERFLEVLSRRKELIRIMYSEIHLYPAKTKQIYRSFIDEMFMTLADYFRGLQDRGFLREFVPETAARAFLGMFFSFFTAQQCHMRKKLDKRQLDSLINEYVGIFAKGTMK